MSPWLTFNVRLVFNWMIPAVVSLVFIYVRSESSPLQCVIYFRNRRGNSGTSYRNQYTLFALFGRTTF